jgi:hypothetical protein
VRKRLSNLKSLITRTNDIIPLYKLFTRNQISPIRWDSFIATSPQRVLYAYSWYLDVVSPHWQALILEENGVWKAVMPLPVQKKWYLSIIQQPFFCQFLGIFTLPNTQTEGLQTAFFNEVSTHFCYMSSYAGRFLSDNFPPNFDVKYATTHTIRLDTSYDTVRQCFSADRRLNLRRAVRFGWETLENEDINPMIDLFRENHASAIQGGVSEHAYELLRKVVETLQIHKAARIMYALKDGKIEAGALFALHDQRIIYLFNSASSLGRKGNARTLLINQILNEYASSNSIFDFESPEKESIAAFYHSFGATTEPYVMLHFNRLPFPLKQLQTYRRKKALSRF